MANLIRGVFAEPGSFAESGVTPPGGGATIAVGKYDPYLRESVDAPFLDDKDNGESPKDPPVPIISLPDTITIPSDDSISTTDIGVHVFPIPIDRVQTLTYFVDPNEDMEVLAGTGSGKKSVRTGDVYENPDVPETVIVVEPGGGGGTSLTAGIPLTLSGALVSVAELNGITGFTASLTNLTDPKIDDRSNIIYSPIILINIPTDTQAQAFYDSNPLLLDKIQVTGDYEIVYDALFPGEEVSYEWYRYRGSFRIPVSILGSKRLFSYPSGVKSYSFISTTPLSQGEQAVKRKFTIYGDGLTNPALTFYNSNTISDSIAVSYGYQRGTLLSDIMDETVRGILEINEGKKIDDYVYSAITSAKVLSSIDSDVQKVLKEVLTLNGNPIENMIGAALMEAIIRNEYLYFSKGELLDLVDLSPSRTKISRAASYAENNVSAMDIILQNSISINPDDYNIKTKNRLLNWKTLSEDLNKRIIFKTADQTETPIYIPNNDTIPILDYKENPNILEMQDGDFFIANTITGDKRLKVFSDIAKARILPYEYSDQASYLAREDFIFTLDASSATSALVEFNVDASSARQDYYFLKLDKDTVEEVPNDSILTKKTKAVYNYDNSAIDDFVKHKAFPYLIIYLRHDDMLFNHLENTNEATLVFKDFTLDYFSNTPEDYFLVRQLPQHMLLIPSDRTHKVVTHTRSSLVDFNTRRANLTPSPFKEDVTAPTKDPLYLKAELTTTDSINFEVDTEKGVIYQEAVKYIFDSSSVLDINQYNNNTEVLPRKKLPTSKVLEEINNIKTSYSLTSRNKITVYDVVSRLEPYDFRSLYFDQADYSNFLARLRSNLITNDKTINETYFLPVVDISNIEDIPFSPLPYEDTSPQVTGKQIGAGKSASRVPLQRGGSYPST